MYYNDINYKAKISQVQQYFFFHIFMIILSNLFFCSVNNIFLPLNILHKNKIKIFFENCLIIYFVSNTARVMFMNYDQYKQIIPVGHEQFTAIGTDTTIQ